MKALESFSLEDLIQEVTYRLHKRNLEVRISARMRKRPKRKKKVVLFQRQKDDEFTNPER